jgi:alkylation response protein AidB-like acyl-CoA dehydrogenase
MAGSLTTARTLVDAARELYPTLDAAWQQSEQDRRVPHDVVELMREAGLFRMVVPSEFGGAATDLRNFVDVLETVARGNSAAAWDLAASSVATLFALGLPPQGLSRIYANGPDVIFAGTATIDRDAAKAIARDGGYEVTGRWRFGSGCQDADWMISSALVLHGGEPRQDQQGNAEMRYFVFPRPSVEILDTWRVIGMRGTGSHDWAVHNSFVPADLSERSPLVQGPNVPRPWRSTLYRVPLASVTALHFSAVATGLARRAIDTLVDLAHVKTPHRAPGLLRERVQVQDALARAEVTLESARAYRDQAIDDAWATLTAGNALSIEQRARIRLAGANAAESAARAVDLMYGAGGTTSIEEDHPLSRFFRDVHVIAQHVTVLPLYYEMVGRAFLGLELDGSRPF